MDRKAYKAAWYQRNKERVRTQHAINSARWYQKNKEKKNNYWRERRRRRKAEQSNV